METIINNQRALAQFLCEARGQGKGTDAFLKVVEAVKRQDPVARVPIETVSRNINQAAALLNEPNLGLKMADHLKKAHKQLFFFVKEAQFSLFEYLRILSRYARITSEIVSPEVIEQADHMILQLNPNSPETISHHQIEGMTAMIHSALSEIGCPTPVRLTLPHRPPSDDMALYKTVYGLQPEFEQPHIRLYFDRDSRELPLGGDQANDTVTVLQRLEARHGKVFSDENILERSRFLLETLLYLGQPSKQQLAAILCVTPRTLQRRLAEHNMTFRDLLKALRIELATRHLKTGQVSCGELAFVLGYQDYSQFHRAFKDWFGEAPERYRQRFITLTDV